MIEQLEVGKYYYCKKDNSTMRYDGWVMQAWCDYDNTKVGWQAIPPLEDLEEVTWGTRAIPLQDFSDTEHY